MAIKIKFVKYSHQSKQQEGSLQDHTNTKQKGGINQKNNQNRIIASSPSTSTSSPKVKNALRRVSFHTGVSVQDTISHKDFTEQEKSNSWWNEEEFVHIRKSCAKQIHKMDSGAQFKDIKYCSRGLEGHTRLGSISKYKARNESIDAVLDTQDNMIAMRVNPCDRDVYIAHAYSRVTSSCQIWANRVGLSDARDAFDILIDVDGDCNANNDYQQDVVYHLLQEEQQKVKNHEGKTKKTNLKATRGVDHKKTSSKENGRKFLLSYAKNATKLPESHKKSILARSA